MNYKLIGISSLLVLASCDTKELAPAGASSATGVAARSLVSLPANTVIPTEVDTSGAAPGLFSGQASVTSDGAASYTLPLWVPPGRAGMQPDIALAYQGAGSDGLLGNGWGLSGLSRISRCNKTVSQDGVAERITFTSADVFCLDGQRLVATQGTYGASDTVYRTERDTFVRVISRAADAQGPARFEVSLKDGRILTYGQLNGSTFAGKRIAVQPAGAADFSVTRDSEDSRLSWSLARVEDRSGNALDVHYSVVFDAADSTYEHLPVQIAYTSSLLSPGRSATRFVDFSYENRPDPRVSYLTGLKMKLGQRLTTIKMRVANPDSGVREVQRSYVFGYEGNALNGRSMLKQVKTCDGRDVCMKPVTFDYSVAGTGFLDINTGFTDITDKGPRAHEPPWWLLQPADLNGDGRDDLAYRWPYDVTGNTFGWRVRYGSASGYGAAEGLALTYQDCLASGPHDGRWVDINLDGRTDVGIVMTPVCADGEFEHDTVVATRTAAGGWGASLNLVSTAQSALKFHLADLDGDGYPEFIRKGDTNTQPMVKYWPNVAGQLAAAPLSVFPSTSSESPAYAIDVDGSGRASLITTERQWGSTEVLGTRYYAARLLSPGTFNLQETTLVRPDVNSKSYIFLDLNGDGLPDALRTAKTGGDLEVLMNTGQGFAAPTFHDLPPQYEVGRWDQDNGLRPFDFDQDGRQELLLMDNRDGARSTLAVLQFDGQQFVPRNLPVLVGRSVPGGYRVSQVLDANGDGLADLAQVFDGTLHIYQRQGPPTGLLTSVTDSFGARVDFDYKPMIDASVYTKGAQCGPSEYCIKNGVWLVSEMRTHVTPTATRSLFYTYEDARVDVRGGGWLGFAKMKVEDPLAGQTVVTEYDLQTKVGAFRPYAKLPVKETTTTQLATRFRRTVRTTQYRNVVRPDAQTPRILAVFPQSTVAEEYEGTDLNTPASATLLHSTTTTWNFDDVYGNMTLKRQMLDTGEQSTWTADYLNTEATWLIGLPRSTSDSSTVAGETVVRNHSLEYYPGTALLKTETLSPENEALKLVATYVREPDGQVSQVVHTGRRVPTDAQLTTRTTRITYDSYDRTFPASVTNAMNHTEFMVYHWGLGVQAAAQDANGVVTTWDYDGFGRTRNEYAPDDADISVHYLPGTGSRAFEVSTSQVGGGEVLKGFDQSGRDVSTRSRTFQGDYVTASTDYDLLGRPVYSRAPSPLDPQRQVTTQTTYDNLGRAEIIRLPDNQAIVNRYEGLTTTSLDPRLGKRVVRLNSAGAPSEVEEWKDSGVSFKTRYVYGPFGVLKSVTDAQGNVSAMAYDPYGRRTVLDDPDSGENRVTYNPFGEVVETLDANGTRTTIDRDNLGRQTTVTSTRDGISHFVWDSAANGLGRLARSERVGDPATTLDDIIEGHTYDSLGRASSDVWNVDGKLYTLERTFDAQGRVNRLRYPAVAGQQLALRYEYSAFGDLQSLKDDSTGYTYWAVESRNAIGQLTRERLGNSVVSERSYDINGRLRFIDSKAGSTPLQALAYEYDANGNLSSRHDLLGRTTEDFSHDGLNRLSQWKVFQNCRTSIMDYQYDSIGNLLGAAVTQGTGAALSLHYENTGNAGPHAATRSNKGSLTYDANGNQLTAPGRVVEYTGFNLPSRISTGTGSVTFRYDANGVRTVKLLPNGDRTLYVGGHYEERSTSAGTTTHVFSIQGPESTVAQVAWTTDSAQQLVGQQRLFMHADHLGSVETVTDDSGSVVEKRKYEPFGGRRWNHDLTQPLVSARSAVSQGFTQHELDSETGLVNMRGRMYDPELGRFLTADPFVSVPFAGQAFNRYSYVNNNPLNYTDPSGFVPLGEAVIIYDSWYGAYVPAPGMGASVTRVRRDPNVVGVRWNFEAGMGAVLSGTVEAQSHGAAFKPPTLEGPCFVMGGVKACMVGEADVQQQDPVTDRPTPDSRTQFGEASPQFSHFIRRVAAAASSYGKMDELKLAATLDWIAPNWQDWNLQPAGNFAAGFGDFLSFNLTSAIRSWNGTNSFVDKTSGAYMGGQATGFATSLLLGGSGALRPATGATQVVTHWNTAANVASGTIRPGAWVMTGGATVRNYIFSGIMRRYAFTESVTMTVPGSMLRYPRGIEWFKGLMGQRIYMP